MFNVNIFSFWISDFLYTGTAEEEFDEIIDEDCPECPRPQNGSIPIKNNATIFDANDANQQEASVSTALICLYVFLGLLGMATISFISYKISQSLFNRNWGFMCDPNVSESSVNAISILTICVKREIREISLLSVIMWSRCEREFMI